MTFRDDRQLSNYEAGNDNQPRRDRVHERDWISILLWVLIVVTIIGGGAILRVLADTSAALDDS